MTVFSEPVADIAGADDTTMFVFYRESLSENAAGNGIATSNRVRIKPVDGVLTTPPLEPGPAKVEWNGKKYDVVIPDSPTPVRLWPQIQNYNPPPKATVYAVTLDDATDTVIASNVSDAESDTRAALDATYATHANLARNPDLLIVGTVTRNGNGAATSAPVVWPDGSPGTYTATTLSTAFPGAVDAYTITYGSPVTRTYTQPAVTRNAAGAATAVPAIVVS
ncbi:hypothetical protein [Rhodococcus sp. USK13]|uniref:hypothetical protein n=1 Tax=Rhodococcus sp. USK13 TaxID=2806442 RepID=UPI001BCAF786|nr:hypothetical protein [Rhodococcus sp. USK13]